MIPTLEHEGLWFSEEAAKSELAFQYFNDILGTNFTITHDIDLDRLGVPRLELQGIDDPFSEEEVWAMVRDMPGDRAPGPDGFAGLFYKAAWPVIKSDIMVVFHVLWDSDFRSFHLINDAVMILLRKNQAPSSLKDYRPISLMHSFSKLFAKCLARRLAPDLSNIVRINQSAFIRGRSIHDNFRTVHLSYKWLHGRGVPSVLVKIDIAKAFDSIA